MLRTMRRAAVVALALAMAGTPACGGGSDGDGKGPGGDGGARSLRVQEGGDEAGVPVVLKGTTCRFDGDRQLLAGGIVRNAGDKASSYVNVSVRFVDASGVRVDIASDSVSDLQRGESARWSASVYVDEPDDVVGCIVTTTAS
jgi:hypothetical protein